VGLCRLLAPFVDGGPPPSRRDWGTSGVLGALLAPWLAPDDPFAQDLTRRLIPPVWYAKGTWAHAFGTDNLGRDYLSRIIFGARISLLTGVSVMVISGLIGTALGLAAGYFGGRTDMAVTFVITVRLALPLILVALAVVATMPYPLHPLS
jgi:peptide/nickel transport system permease protein